MDVLEEVLLRAERHAVKRSSFAGPPVNSITVSELTVIIAQVREIEIKKEQEDER